MNENLRPQYFTYLHQFNLKPRPVPDNQFEIQQAMLAHMLELNSNDSITRAAFETLQADSDRYREETRHPATILLEVSTEQVEKAIAIIPSLAGAFRQDIFVGEFPTGRINAQAKSVDGGYLVLVDSGCLTVIKQATEYLVIYGDPDHPNDREANRTAIEGIVEVLDSYLEFGDPFFGPKPLSGGLEAYVRHFVAKKMLEFVLAHEYGHVLAGHFKESHGAEEIVDTNIGQVSLLRKSQLQELEADIIAYKIVLGVEKFSDINLTVMDKPYEDPEHCSGADWADALKLKSALAAPFIFLTFDSLLETVNIARSAASGKAQLESSHPSARTRMDRLMAEISKLPPIRRVRKLCRYPMGK